MKENISNKIVHNSRFKAYSYLKIVAVCCLFTIISCKAKKQLVVNKPHTDSTAAPVDNKSAKLDAIKAAQDVFGTFSGKARTKLTIGSNTNDVTLNIRIKRDQKIWVSVTAIAGIEVARALITPDSILLINRLQSLYIRQPFSYIYKFTGKQVNYKTVESLLVGNIIPELVNENADIQGAAGNITLTGNLQQLLYKLILGPDMKVTQANLNNQSAAQSLQVNNSAFIQAANKLVPSQIDITSLVKAQKIQVNLHYIKIDFDQPLDYPFTIPSRYQPAAN
jgi:hypothetical protein